MGDVWEGMAGGVACNDCRCVQKEAKWAPQEAS